MKKFTLFLFTLFLGFGISFAQHDEAKREQRMKEVLEYKMKFLAQEMELNDAQKKKFFEVYSEMAAARSQCFKDFRQLERRVKNESNASEKEYQQLTETKEKANAQWIELEKKYNDKFSEFLTSKQIFKMSEAEAVFKAKLNEMKHRGKEKQRRPDAKK